MSILELSKKDIESHFVLFCNSNRLDENFSNLLKDMSLIQKKYYTLLQENYTENYAKQIQKKIKINQDPLLDHKNFYYDITNAESIFNEILELMLSEDSQLQATAKEIKIQLSSGNIILKQLFESFLKEKQNYFTPYIKQFSSSPNIMFFLAYNSLLPSILLTTKVLIDYSKIDLSIIIPSKACPICGSAPYISSLGVKQANSAGIQYNHCSFCQTKYRVKRLQCPFCKCEDHTKLGFYSIEQFPDIQIHICNECRNYIKLQESQSLSPLELIDILSLSLDIAIQNESYTRQAPLIN